MWLRQNENQIYHREQRQNLYYSNVFVCFCFLLGRNYSEVFFCTQTGYVKDMDLTMDLTKKFPTILTLLIFVKD